MSNRWLWRAFMAVMFAAWLAASVAVVGLAIEGFSLGFAEAAAGVVMCLIYIAMLIAGIAFFRLVRPGL